MAKAPAGPRYIPAPRGKETVPGFENTAEHFKIYVEVRKAVNEEIRVRSRRRWVILTQMTALYVTVIAGLFVLATQGPVVMPDVYPLLLMLMLTVMSGMVFARVILDESQIVVHRAYLRDLDQIFGLQVRDGQPWARFLEWCSVDANDHDFVDVNNMDLPKPNPSRIMAYGVWLGFLWLITAAFLVALPLKTLDGQERPTYFQHFIDSFPGIAKGKGK